MDKKTVFVKTEMGDNEVSGQTENLFGEAQRILNLVDDESTVGEISKRAPPSLRGNLYDVLQELLDNGYIKDIRRPLDEPKNKVVSPAAKIASPAYRMAAPKAATAPIISAHPAPKLSATSNTTAASVPTMRTTDTNVGESSTTNKITDLDFSFISSAPRQKEVAVNKGQSDTAEKARQDAEAARLKAAQFAQSEAVAKAAKQKSYEEAKQRAQIEVAAKARIEAEAKLKQEAEAARLKAEKEAQNARNVSEAAKARIEMEVRARIETEARVKREAEAVRSRAEKEAESLRVELEAAKARAELEARNRIEAEVRAKAEAEARMKREAEAERLRVEKERAELEIARVKAEAEIKLRTEAELRIRAEVDARLKVEALAKQVERRNSQQAGFGEIGGYATTSNEDQDDSAEKLRQTFVDSFGVTQANQESHSNEFKLEKFSLLDTGKMAALTGQKIKPNVLPGGGSKVKTAIEERARKEAEVLRLKSEQEAAKLQAELDEAARIKAERESRRLMAEHEAYRLKIQQDEERAIAEAEARKLTEQQSKQWEEGQRRAAAQAEHANAEHERLLAKQFAETESKSSQKSARRARKPFPIWKIFAGLLALALIAVAGLPYLWPTDEYIAPLETEISAQIKQPVHIKKISFALLPKPKLVLLAVAVGKGEELKVGDVIINFDISALFAPTKSINKLELSAVTVSGPALDKVMAWLQAAGGIEKYPVARMELNGVRLYTDEIKLPLLNGKADFDPQGNLIKAALKSNDEKLDMELQLQQGKLKIEVNLKESSFPVFPSLKFNDASFNALVVNGEAVLSDFFAHINGGTITGQGRLSWVNGWKMQGQVNAKSMDLQRMFPGTVLNGELLGDANISMTGMALSQLDREPRVEGSFEAKNGVINKIDIETAARFGTRPGVAGHTNFSEFTGTIKSDKNGQHIVVSRLASSAATSTGLIDVDSKQQLSAKLQTEIKGLGLGGLPLQLSGSVTEPTVLSGH
jgi:hypothetical protein